MSADEEQLNIRLEKELLQRLRDYAISLDLPLERLITIMLYYFLEDEKLRILLHEVRYAERRRGRKNI